MGRYSDWSITTHALEQAASRLGCSLEEAAARIRSGLARARRISARKCAALLGEHPWMAERRARRRRRIGKANAFYVIGENPLIVAVGVPVDRTIVTVLVQGRMLPVHIRHNRDRALLREIEFKTAANRQPIAS